MDLFSELLEKTIVLRERCDDGLDHMHGRVANGKNINWINTVHPEFTKNHWWIFGSACCMNSNTPHIICDNTVR